MNGGVAWKAKGRGTSRRQQVVTVQSRQWRKLPVAGEEVAVLAAGGGGLRLFGVTDENLTAVTCFRLDMVQRARFTAQLFGRTATTPGTFGFLLGDAANAIHFWPGRGLNSGLASALSLGCGAGGPGWRADCPACPTTPRSGRTWSGSTPRRCTRCWSARRGTRRAWAARRSMSTGCSLPRPNP
jgi:hypothetical protein